MSVCRRQNVLRAQPEGRVELERKTWEELFSVNGSRAQKLSLSLSILLKKINQQQRRQQ